MPPVSSSTESAVLAANRAFYEAFTERDPGAMSRVWAREHPVACTHPGRGALHGRDAVLASWRAILDSPEAPGITFAAVAAVVLREAAFVTCIEHIGEARLAATNVFALEGGEWKIVHHHAGPLPPERESRRPKPSTLN
jgi:ketosteroid isomerase-like protein